MNTAVIIPAEEYKAIVRGLEEMNRKIDQLSKPAPDWLPVKDYAAHVNRTVKTVNNWIAAGVVVAEYRGKVRGVRMSQE